MRLLVITQIVDRTDPTLGFFVPWIEELARRVEQVEVLCLKKGTHTLPDSVRVRSLGKETMRLPRPLARVAYLVRFCSLLLSAKSYDAVFVHMNEEYVLLAGLYWRLTGKRVYLWRNHYEGSFLTDIAASFCTKVFCTSRYSYTARYKKTVIMPTGVNIDSLSMEVPVAREPRTILSLARLSPSKRPELLLEAYALLAKRGIDFTARFVGGVKEPESGYLEALRKRAEELGIASRVEFLGPVPNTETFKEYRRAEVFVNASPSGMLDKTMFKAMAAGSVVVAASKDLAAEVEGRYIFNEQSVEHLADTLAQALTITPEARQALMVIYERVLARHELPVLMDTLVSEMAPG